MPKLSAVRVVGLVAGLSCASGFFAACAESVEKKDFGEDFSGRDASRPDVAVPAVDSSSPPPDATTLSDGSRPEDATLPDAAPPPDASACTGTIAVLSGDENALAAAVKTRGSWTTQALAGESTLAGPALVPFGAGFQAAFRGSGDALKIVTATTAAFGAPARLGTASTRGTPTLATNGAALHLLYQDPTFNHMHSAWTGTAFEAPATIGTPPSFGPEPLTGAVLATELVAAFGGDSQGALYTQVRTGTVWTPAAAVLTTNVCATAGGGGVSRCGGAPALLATGGATVDLLAVHVDRDSRLLTVSTRNAPTKAFTAQGPVLAATTSDEEVFLARLSATRAVLVFRGQNGLGYATLADLAQAPPRFATPVALSATALASVPRVAPGVCGDDASAVFVTAAGQVRLVRLRGTTWGGEEAVGSVPNGKFAAVATRP